MLHLNTVDEVIERAIDDFTPIDSVASPPSKCNIKPNNAAIRFEKQMSYSNNKRGSSLLSANSSSGAVKEASSDSEICGRPSNQ